MSFDRHATRAEAQPRKFLDAFRKGGSFPQIDGHSPQKKNPVAIARGSDMKRHSRRDWMRLDGEASLTAM